MTSEMRAILFTDLVGSTETAERVGHETYERYRRQHFAAMREAIAACRGTEVKTVGDAFMAVFEGAADAVACGMAMQEAQARLRHAGIAPGLRVGISAGDVTAEGGDYFGLPVVEASRLCAAAGADQVLVSDLVRLVDRGGAHRFESVGNLDLKGFREPVAASSVVLEVPEASAFASGRTPFVGRESERARLSEMLGGAATGRGGLALISGEPGIGKTRLAEEVAAEASERGFAVFAGGCYEGEGAPPFWPWIQVVRSMVRGSDADSLGADMGPGAADIAEVVEEVKERLPGLEPPPPLEPERARFRLFDSLTTFLKRSSIRRPLLLSLDDLHWADKPSLMLLVFLAKELADARMVVLCTYRDVELGRRHPLAESLGELARVRAGNRVVLRGLDREDVSRLIGAAARIAPPDTLVTAVFEETEGNPFFVSEVVQLLAARGLLGWQEAAPAWDLEVPQGVREAIGRRLSLLSEECNRVLAMASVVGREFRVDVLERVADAGRGELLELLDEAVAARILSGPLGLPARFDFTHALIRQTLYEELSATRRTRLHQRAGDVLEDVYGERAVEHAAELAHHYAEAANIGGPEQLVKYATAAGKRAAASYAWEEAAAQFDAALTAMEGRPLGGDKVDLLLQAGQAHIALLHLPDALRNLTESFEYSVGAGDVQRAVAAIECVSHYLLLPYLDHELYDRALALVPSGSADAGRIWRCLAMWANAHGASELADRASLEALMLAQNHDDRRAVLDSLQNRAVIDHFSLRMARSRDAFPRIIELAEDLGAQAVAVEARFLLAYDCMFATGELRSAERHLKAALDDARQLRDRWSLLNTYYGLAECANHRGDWAGAGAAIEAGLQYSPDERLAAQGFHLWINQGDLERAGEFQSLIGEQAGLFGLGSSVQSILISAMEAWVTGSLHAVHRGEEVGRSISESPPLFNFPLLRHFAHVALGLLAAVRRDREAAEERYALLAPSASIFLGDWVLGLLAATLGRLDDAVAHLDAAYEFSLRGYRPYQVWTACDGAGVRLQRNALGDAERARELLSESIGFAEELGMKPYLERALALEATLAPQRPRAPANPGGLSDREVEVLRLVAGGQTNAEIAEALVISPHTVGRHVSNIFDKLGTTNRADAAAWAVRHGLDR